MYCTKCGTEIIYSVKPCPKCGHMNTAPMEYIPAAPAAPPTPKTKYYVDLMIVSSIILFFTLFIPMFAPLTFGHIIKIMLEVMRYYPEESIFKYPVFILTLTPLIAGAAVLTCSFFKQRGLSVFFSGVSFVTMLVVPFIGNHNFLDRKFDLEILFYPPSYWIVAILMFLAFIFSIAKFKKNEVRGFEAPKPPTIDIYK